MARLRTRHDDGKPFGNRATVRRSVLGIALCDPRAEEPDQRPKVVASERLWWRASMRLAYRAGDELPADELPLLVGDGERLARRGGGPR